MKNKMISNCCNAPIIEVESAHLCSKCIEHTTRLPYKNVKLFYKILKYTFMLFLVGIPYLYSDGSTKVIPMTPKKVINRPPPLTVENFIAELAKNNFTKYDSVALAQARKESGFGSSELYKLTNNLFGLTSVNKGYKVVDSEGNVRYFTVFNDWRESVKAWCLWMDKMYTSPDKLLIAIGKVYCPENANYANEVKQLMK